MTERVTIALIMIGAVLTAPMALGQARRSTLPAATAMRTEAAKVTCPQSLGQGVQTGRSFCDVLVTREPAEGVIIALPAHTGAVTLTFDLHNRHTVHSEFRTAKDLFDRIAGGSGPAGVKAVAPTGTEPVTIVIPADEPTESISIVGLRLTEGRVDGTDVFQASGRPIAIISNVMLQYRPAPPPRTPARRK
jgi:hypothetical protein